MMEDAGIQWLGAGIFFTLHMVQINLQIILLLHSGFRLRGKSKMTGSNLEETSFFFFFYQQSKCLGCLKLLRQEILRLKLFKTMLRSVKRGIIEGSSDTQKCLYGLSLLFHP